MTFLQNSTINRKSFRHRKVDNKKPLRIYTPGEINEDDCIPVSRAGIEIETGVEKEEEEVRFTCFLVKMYYVVLKFKSNKHMVGFCLPNGVNNYLFLLKKILEKECFLCLLLLRRLCHQSFITCIF